ncbi:hypothetical protein FRB95_007202 [Tulasnella sp. JGI-2019a]|nr:hypothetical protein FRB93_013645 [Tulasnella sp. JGI-2019a]KAG9039775.1 hypothetical protein FRB95_007202 [Tulasnella sp. JGI-2019a]
MPKATAAQTSAKKEAAANALKRNQVGLILRLRAIATTRADNLVVQACHQCRKKKLVSFDVQD